MRSAGVSLLYLLSIDFDYRSLIIIESYGGLRGVMKPEQVRRGAPVRVSERHRIEERRGIVGKVVGKYGGDGYVAVDVRFADGRCRLFWPEDLEDISSVQPRLRARWRWLLGWSRA